MSDDEKRALGREMQGKLWPATLTGPTGRFPAAELAPDHFDDVLQHVFGTLWQRPGLATRDRSMVTVAVLAALGHTEELKAHLRGALNVGLTKEELVEVLMHISAYAGVPAAGGALRAAAEVLQPDA